MFKIKIPGIKKKVEVLMAMGWSLGIPATEPKIIAWRPLCAKNPPYTKDNLTPGPCLGLFPSEARDLGMRLIELAAEAEAMEKSDAEGPKH